MDVNIIYNIEHEMPLGILISLYFYLTGLSAGSFIISTMAYGFGMVKFKPLGKIGVVMATLLLVIADNVQDIVDRNNGHDIVDSFVSTSSVLSYYDDSKRSNLIPIRVSPPGLYPAGG